MIHLKTVLFQHWKNGQAHAIFSLTPAPSREKDDTKDRTLQRFVDPEMFSQTESQSNEDDNNEENQDPQQMIYYIECIPAGAWLLQQLYSKFPLDQLELGCLFDGLNAFLRQPTLGGRSSAGYGQVRVQLRGAVGKEPVQWPVEESETIRNAVCAYQNYLTENREEILSALTVKTENNAPNVEPEEVAE